MQTCYNKSYKEEKMTNLWDHLPNAKYIDAIIASVKAHLNEWVAANALVRDKAMNKAWNAAWYLVCNAERGDDLDVALDATWDAIWEAALNDRFQNIYWKTAKDVAWDAIHALIAYDDCAYMLESDPGELAILAKFGDQRAVLLLPACKALAAIKEKENGFR